jgi:hypothetical protein
MGINDWKSLLMGYLRDSGHKNPKVLMSRHKDLLNYFYIKKLPPEEVNLFFGNKMKNLSAAEYLEILRAKRASSASGGAGEARGANYADSMVFYKGKALGRCPAGTTRSGKTCVPSAAPPSKGPGYKQTDLGGLSQAQVKALSKARSTKDIIEAHKKSNKK